MVKINLEMTLSTLFHNRSTLALITSNQQQQQPVEQQQRVQPTDQRPTEQQQHNPYRSNNSRFTLSFNNLINRSKSNKRPQQQEIEQTHPNPLFNLMQYSLGPSPPTSPTQPQQPQQQQQQQQHPAPKSPYFPGLRRIQSRRRENTSNLLSSILSPGSSSSTQENERPPPLPQQYHSSTTNLPLTQPTRSTSQPPPIPRVIRSATERIRTNNTNQTLFNMSSTHNLTTPTNDQQQTPSHPNDNSNQPQLFSLRLVPHLDATRSLHFEPIERKLSPSTSLKLGRFTDRGTPQTNSDSRIAFKSKVVSRGHADIFTDQSGSFFIRDTKSSSGTFLNHIRLSAPGGESRPFPLRDGDVLQLGVDYQGGTEEIYRCVKMRVELNRGWQRSANAFNQQALAQLRSLGAKGTAVVTTTPSTASAAKDSNQKALTTEEPPKAVSDCCICLFGVTVCQALFIAPCSHTYHYKCIRPLLQMHHPGFSCPLCRTFADLEADVETDDQPAPAPPQALPESVVERSDAPPSHNAPPSVGNNAESTRPLLQPGGGGGEAAAVEISDASSREEGGNFHAVGENTVVLGSSPPVGGDQGSLERAHTMVMSSEMAAAYHAATMGPARSMGSVEEASEEEQMELAAGIDLPATATSVDSGHHRHQASSHQRCNHHGRRSSDNNSVLSDVNSSLASDDLRSNSLHPVPAAAHRVKPSKHTIVGGSPPADLSLVNHAAHSADHHHHKPLVDPHTDDGHASPPVHPNNAAPGPLLSSSDPAPLRAHLN
ncbi:hypothetical protein VP01_2846g2 [Puccinia sorghi]|uniref:FHA domain-containing protein n=1 Tax=Puccinia sorghi TaxID=27349 RepID=A0A0L6V3U9_9BASI|nr:hypothetical protein VP01_2846g2 [Puccinia sorghi]